MTLARRGRGGRGFVFASLGDVVPVAVACVGLLLLGACGDRASSGPDAEASDSGSSGREASDRDAGSHRRRDSGHADAGGEADGAAPTSGATEDVATEDFAATEDDAGYADGFSTGFDADYDVALDASAGSGGLDAKLFVDAGVLDAALADASPDVYPGPRPETPSVISGGTVLPSPNIVPVFFAGDPYESDLVTFLSALPGSTSWGAMTAEYGVGAVTVGSPILLSSSAPSSVAPSDVAAFVSTNVSGASPPWGAPASNNVYVVFYPASTTFLLLGAAGFHGMAGAPAPATSVTFAAISEAFAKTTNDVTPIVVHELVEDATDPYWGTATQGYDGVDAKDLAWEYTFLNGVFDTVPELGDMCMIYPDSVYTPPDLPFAIQRTWSNASIAAGHAPCVPVPSGVVYFNSALVPTDNIVMGLGSLGPGKAVTHGVKIPLGSTRTVDVELYSDAPTPGPWTISAAPIMAGDLLLSFDKTSGQNGDVVHLTITAIKQDSGFGAEGFIITSALGSQTTRWYGVVGN